MWYKYRAITCNFLPGTSKYFFRMEDAIDHIKKIIDEKEPWVTDEQVHISYRLMRIDDRWYDNGKKERLIKKVFPEREKTPVTVDYVKEVMRPDLVTEEESTQELQSNK